LNLAVANRDVIYDPAWNSAADEQCVNRVYCIGQKKNVVIYRLITCKSIEEKMTENRSSKNLWRRHSL